MRKSEKGNHLTSLSTILLMALAVAMLIGVVSSRAYSQATGFSVSNGRLYDANGNEFIMRGINHAHTWYPTETSSFANIKATGANTVRVVLSSGDRWTQNSASDVANVIQLCKTNRLICVLEVHDTTGYGEQSGAASLSQAVAYWMSIQSVLTGEEAYVIINLGNEPYGNSNYGQWTAETQAAIVQMRKAGFTHTLMVDAPNWGQDWSFTMRDNATQVFNSDPQQNLLFDVHMYGVFDTSAEIEAYLTSFTTRNLPIVIGEFGDFHSDGDPDEDAILSWAESLSIGYIGWSWSGNGSGVEYLDIAQNFNPNSLSAWGNRLINGTNGIAATSQEASVFGTQPPTATPGGQTATATPLPSATPIPATQTPAPAGACDVDYIVHTWSGAYQANVTITNNSATPIAGWTLTFTHAPGQVLTGGWNATLSQTGQAVTASNTASHWNGTIPANGGQVTFGLQASRTGYVIVPTDFAVNGLACDGSTPLPTATSSPATATTVPPTATAEAPTATPNSSSNLALNRPATASSNDGYAGPAGDAFDGNTSTRWASAWSDPQWIQVDLGATVAIEQVVLKWEAAYGSAYEIQVSDDASTWTTLASVSNGDGSTDTVAVAGSGRYVRMVGTQRATQWGYSLWEMEVYGAGSGPTPTQTPTAETPATATPIQPTATPTTSQPTATATAAPPTPTPGPGTIVLSHNDATYSGSAENVGTHGELRGNPSAIGWSFNVPADGEYRVTLRYSTPHGSKVNHFGVDGLVSAVTFNSTAEADYTMTLSLDAGTHSATLSAQSGDWGYMNAHGLTVELLGGLNILSPANFSQLPSGSDILVDYEKFGTADLLYTINNGPQQQYAGASPLTISTSGDDIYRIAFSLAGTNINQSLRVTVGNPPDPGFVETQGTQFVLNGQPWYFNGTNQYYLMFKPTAMTDDFFARADALGMNAVRTWMFCHHTSTHDGACVNQYDGGSSATAEEAREHFLALKSNPTPEEQALLDFSWGILDHYVAQAEARDIKLILALGDNWPANSMGGIDVFARAVGSNGIAGAYANPEARELYKMWIDVVLNHVNSETGIAYKDDPTIMMWELANEPRCTGGSGCTVGSADYQQFNTWIGEISAHIKQEAPNQLVSIGAELDNNDTDAFVLGIHDHDTVDVVSAHLYPKPWGLTTDAASLALVQSRVDLARQIGKPLYYGEFSYRMEQNSAEADALHRANLFTALFDLAYDNRDVLGGMMNWQLSGLEYGNGNVGSCQWCSGPYGEYSGGWYGNHDGYQFYCVLDPSENSISGVGAPGTNVEGTQIHLDWHAPTCDAVSDYSAAIAVLNGDN